MIIDAIQKLAPNAEVSVNADDLDQITWLDGNPLNITKEQIQEKLVEVQAEDDAQEYARNRRLEYPDMGTQFNKIYDDGLTKWKSEMVDPIKTKWPKDNSGPIE